MPAGDSTIVVTLGTGTPVPNPERAGPATAVVVGSRVFLFDAGPGVMRRIAAAGLPIDGVTAAFITHLHSDHTLGLPDLILTSWVMGRSAPMRLYGPRGLRRMTDHFLAAWAEDTLVRITGLERARPGGYRVDTREIGPGVVFDSGGVKVTAIPVPHGSWEQAFAFRIDTPRRSVVISGDTRASDALARASSGVDVLVVEIYPETRAAPEPRPGGELWPRYLREFHISDVEVGRMAAAARPGLLVLSHVLLLGGTEAELLEGIRRAGYDGPVVIARDLQRF
ncbi:MAG TPA: MBL fold metallo-hydrolase [Gemmatimonadaceae bacterium]|nr:MBL fold metallo-hydrolase [Gemmatimonadaceae bacterium]